MDDTLGRSLAEMLIKIKIDQIFEMWPQEVTLPGFQGQVIDSTLITLSDVKALPAPVPNNTPECCRKMDSDEPL